MVTSIGRRCIFEIVYENAEAVSLCSKSLPRCCPMQHRLGHLWFALLIFPPGEHSFRYYAHIGRRNVLIGEETIVVEQDDLSWQV